MKLESRIKDGTPEEETEDNFLEALNASTREVWGESNIQVTDLHPGACCTAHRRALEPWAITERRTTK